MGRVAGLRGGAVQHGPDASQQHPRPEEDDVTLGSGAQAQSREPPTPLAANPQPTRTPGPPPTTSPKPHGPPLSRELSAAVDPKRRGLSLIKTGRWKGHASKPEYAAQEEAQKSRILQQS